MSYNVLRIPVAGIERSNGQEFAAVGTGLMLLPSSYAPPNLRLALDEPTDRLLPIMPGAFIRHDFSSLWVYHDLAGGGYPEPLTIITTDDPYGYILNSDATFRGSVHDASMSGIVAAGNTQVLVAVNRRRTRLLAYRFQLTANATLAVAGSLVMQLQSTGIGIIPETITRFYVPDAMPAGAFGSLDTGWLEFAPGGYLLEVSEPSLTLGRVNAQLNVALLTGEAVVSIRYRREEQF